MDNSPRTTRFFPKGSGFGHGYGNGFGDGGSFSHGKGKGDDSDKDLNDLFTRNDAISRFTLEGEGFGYGRGGGFGFAFGAGGISASAYGIVVKSGCEDKNLRKLFTSTRSNDG